MRGYQRPGHKKWQRHVERIVALLEHGLQADYVMLGGRNVKKLTRLPEDARVGDNAHAILGGIRLWDAPKSARHVSQPRTRRPTGHKQAGRSRRRTADADSDGPKH